MLTGDVRDDLVGKQLAAAERRVRDQRHAVPRAGLEQFGLVEVRVVFALVRDQRQRRQRDGTIEQRHWKVRYADMTRQAAALRIAERAYRLLERHLGIGPMHEQQVDVIESKP